MNYSINLKQKSGKILRRLISLALAIFSLTLYSCSSSDPYPVNWGDVMDVQKHGDSVISGSYSSMGIRCSNGSTGSICNIIELPGFSVADSNIDNIVIKLYKKDSLLILLRANSDTIYRTIFPENGEDFSLTEDGLQMEPRKYKGGDLGLTLPLFSNDNVTLMRGADSSLIARYSGWGVALFYMVPVYGSATTWYRFPQYKIK